MEKSINAEKSTYDSFMNISKSLIDLAEGDGELVEAGVDNIEKRWDNISGQCEGKLEKLNDIDHQLNEMNKQILPVEEFITFCQQTFCNQTPIGIDKDKAHDQLAELDVC